MAWHDRSIIIHELQLTNFVNIYCQEMSYKRRTAKCRICEGCRSLKGFVILSLSLLWIYDLCNSEGDELFLWIEPLNVNILKSLVNFAVSCVFWKSYEESNQLQENLQQSNQSCKNTHSKSLEKVTQCKALKLLCEINRLTKQYLRIFCNQLANTCEYLRIILG
jgi:hypothetical protein